jgi:hypothetical protein
MRKLATSLLLGGLALGLPAQAMATEIVIFGCYDWDANPSLAGTVIGSKASSGFTRPLSCVPTPISGPLSCAQCVADLLNAGFTMVSRQVNTANSIGDLTYLFKNVWPAPSARGFVEIGG